jgi:hypothetical protein
MVVISPVEIPPVACSLLFLLPLLQQTDWHCPVTECIVTVTVLYLNFNNLKYYVHKIYTVCPKGSLPDFRSTFLRLNYIDKKTHESEFERLRRYSFIHHQSFRRQVHSLFQNDSST